jgi:aminopeptidase
VIDAERFAALLCDWSLEIGAGQQVLIGSSPLADPLNRAVHRAVLERGAWPLMRIAPPWQREDFFRHAHAAVLDSVAGVELLEAQNIDARLQITAPSNTRALAGIDPALLARTGAARRPLLDLVLARRWCGTVWPTPALAQEAAMSEDDYARFVARALFLDEADPVAAWRELSRRQAEIVAQLSSVHEIRIEAERTDLRLRVDGRTWMNSDGKRNMPSGEVFTGPIEESAEGTIYFGITSAPAGVAVSGVELTFAEGRVVAATAETGQAYLDAALGTDDGARFLGEIGIGTNAGIDRPTGSILLDEKMARTVHLALGNSYPETGGTNVSGLHWDLICDLRDGGHLIADGQMLNEKLWSVG